MTPYDEFLRSASRHRPSGYTFVDDFCGGGGSSQGLREAGLTLVQAANHNHRAIETHSANFPDADHLEADLITYNMRRRPRAHLYWASPECTWHSPAGGRKTVRQMLDMFDEYVPDAAGERSRLTMMQVAAYAEAKRPPIVVVENVVEVTRWERFESWLLGMTELGYEYQILCVSAAHIWSEENAPAPQWRDRIYFVFYQKGINMPDVSPRPLAFCPECCENVRARQAWKRPDRRHIGKYGTQYNYVCPSDSHKQIIVEPWVMPAIDALNMDDLGTPIGSRTGKDALAEATLRRGWVGRQYVQRQALIVATHGQTWDAAKPAHPKFGDPASYYRVQGVDSPLMTRTSTPGDGVMSEPFMMKVNHQGDDPRAFDPTAAPLPTRSTKLGDAIVTPFVTVLRKHSKGIDPQRDPLATIAASGNHHALVTPDMFITRQYSQRGAPETWGHLSRPLSEPLGAITSKDHHSLVIPYRKGRGKSVWEPLPTATTVDWGALATGAAAGPEIPPIEQLRDLMAEWLFRMLQWREHANAQRFPRDYIFTGNAGENTMMAGNAVASNVAHYLGRLCVIALDNSRKTLGLEEAKAA